MDKAIVDHRIYTIRPRCMAAFLEAFEQLAMPILRRHLGTPLGFYVSSIGPLNQVVHLWGYDSLEDFERRSAARDADPDFAAYLQATRDLVVAQETRIIKPVHLRS
ncbi:MULTISPECIES: NIPSNAP family protein [unclassified Pseudomonas]|uniref:NIPSNAP family protein n=1 Tax=unclassified Pseudomonas TaxID=196821 RepID=UPI00128EE570|nr:NIPSNAP family protein [Pseudomonas sp. MN1F]MQG94622.1 NIPSNAP family protein [Pseudomonas sp. MN1F]